MKKSIVAIALFTLTWVTSFSQGVDTIISGKVSFITSDNIYVRFDKTDHISIGDTLYSGSPSAMVSCLVVTQKSSTSCVCTSIQQCDPQVEQEVFYTYKMNVPNDQLEILEDQEDQVNLDIEEPSTLRQETGKSNNNIEKISARISASSYSNFSSVYDNRHRTMLRFSLRALHLNNSKFSLESYANYRQNFIANSSRPDLNTQSLKVYNLALKYDVDSTTSLIIGRKINNKISSLGAIDGLQVEKHFNSFYAGLVTGFRPDIFNFELNPSLLQYGAYIGHALDNDKLYARSTFGLLEQRNGGAIDRRYSYFQHSSTINRNLNIFGSFEIDIYNNIAGTTGAKPRLTNLFISTTYKFSRKLSLSISYDARKRIIYYETLKTDIERLLDDDEARQGIRFRVNIKPVKYVFAGITYSSRFQNNNLNKSGNLNGFISYTRLPVIAGRFSMNYNRNNSNYLSSNIISLRYSRSIIKKRMDGDFYYRKVNYDYKFNELKERQSYYGVNLSYRFNRKFMMNLLGEMSSRSIEKNYRINTKVSVRI